jgi:hypothetical protein
VDEYIAAPYEESFVIKFYDTIGVSDLMKYTVKAGGKIVLKNGDAVLAEDVLENVISHGIRAAAQITSVVSECPTVREDIDALISDPVLSPIVADLVLSVIEGMEIEEPAEDDLMGKIVYDFVNHYKTASEDVITGDLRAIGNAVSVLA